MDNDKIVNKWLQAIIETCEKRLQRRLSQEEATFISSRGGFIALEAIEDTAKSLSATALEKYLNSETNRQA